MHDCMCLDRLLVWFSCSGTHVPLFDLNSCSLITPSFLHSPPPPKTTTIRSILASLATFKSLWVTRSDYQEHGAAIVNKRTL